MVNILPTRLRALDQIRRGLVIVDQGRVNRNRTLVTRDMMLHDTLVILTRFWSTSNKFWSASNHKFGEDSKGVPVLRLVKG